MSYQVLARKWRPKIFEDVIGQDHITRTLKNALLKDKVAHAYLFTGTRGVGKTTVARIFGKALMCQNRDENQNPCLKCRSCLAVDNSTSIDFLEIDGASNNSVENVRELIDNVQYLPTEGKYKVYVIDEVHMLTTSAFNALLKTLEEPPAHVVFIFATTDPQKLLGTVLSRCQRFDFKSVPVELLEKHISYIANIEQFSFESAKVLKEVCKHGNGSVRDTLSLLDQVLSLSSDEIINEQSLILSLGLANFALIQDLINNLLAGRAKETINSYKKIVSENVDFKKFVVQLLEQIFLLIENIDEESQIIHEMNLESTILEQLSLAEIFWIYESLSKDLDWALTSMNPHTNIELSLLKVTLRRQLFSESPVAVNVSEIKKKALKSSSIADVEKIEIIEEQKTWKTFVENLFVIKRTIAVNVERGNLLEELDYNTKQLNVSLGFAEENKIFYDFVQEKESREELIIQIAKYFNKQIEEIDFSVSLLSNEEKVEKNFLSSIEVDQKNDALKKEQQKQTILNNSFIKEAEKLFNTKINKIILNETNLGE